MNYKILSTIIISFLLVSCGSSTKRTFKKDYIVVDASSQSIPEWISAPEKGDDEKSRKSHRYFINDSSNSNKRLCIRSSEARATARVAQEIAQFIKNSFAEATQGGEGEEVSEYMQEQLAQETQSFVVGAGVIKTYWEKRRYQEELGAPEDKTNYTCYALVRMDRKNLQKAIDLSRQKLMEKVKDPEVKEKTDKAIQEASKKFTEA